MDKKRTLTQNNALHLMFDQLAEKLNDAGLDMRKTLKPSIDIPWSKITVKEYLWRPVQKAQLGKDSTTQLTIKEIDLVFETLCKYLGQKHGIEIHFPSIETLLMKQRLKEN